MNRKVVVSVINDLCTDQRVNKTCVFLTNKGFEVTLIGRKQRKSHPIDSRPYKTHRMFLLFEKGFLFYAEYNIRLFIYLLFHRADLLVSNDLDTLLPSYLISKLKRSKLVYDSHEYFTEVPEIVHRKLVKMVWTKLEEAIFPKLDKVITVNDSIANLFNKKYNKPIYVVRNIPPKQHIIKASKSELGITEDTKLIILQGAGINIDRGSEEAVAAMQYINNALLLIIGGGDVIDLLKNYVITNNLSPKVIFLPKMPYKQMLSYTAIGDLGLTLDKDTNINYRFSLPNKLFDYIQAGIPILSTHLVEIETIIRKYDIGDFIENHSPEHIAAKINSFFEDTARTNRWKENLKLAAEELTWENEELVLNEIYLNS